MSRGSVAAVIYGMHLRKWVTYLMFTSGMAGYRCQRSMEPKQPVCEHRGCVPLKIYFCWRSHCPMGTDIFPKEFSGKEESTLRLGVGPPWPQGGNCKPECVFVCISTYLPTRLLCIFLGFPVFTNIRRASLPCLFELPGQRDQRETGDLLFACVKRTSHETWKHRAWPVGPLHWGFPGDLCRSTHVVGLALKFENSLTVLKWPCSGDAFYEK